MKNILFYGNFGLEKDIAVDGQTSKTRNFYSIFRNTFPNQNVRSFNTKNFSKHIIKNLISLRKILKNTNILIIFPGGMRSLKLIVHLTKKYRCLNIFYPIVGGWLADKIKQNKSLIKSLKKMKCLYPETKGLQDQLNSLGISNTKISPVFSLRKKDTLDNILRRYKNRKSDLLKFIYFGRVSEQKGIYLAIDSIKKINKNSDIICSLDIYGKLQDGENTAKFFSTLDNHIHYFGVLPDEQINILGDYDFFLFPTFYKGEGLPAACVESLLFGTPIIASDWAYNSEFVQDGFNGFLFCLDPNNLYDKLIHIVRNTSDIIQMKINAYKSSLKYLPEEATKSFIDDLSEVLKNE